MNTEGVRDCILFHLEREFSATANFFEMTAESATSSVESGNANIAVLGAQEFSSFPATIEIIVTAIGVPEADNMSLSRGDSFNELAMVSGAYNDGSFTYGQTMGDSEPVSMLSDLSFAAAAMSASELPQHFHLVQITCN